MPEETKIDVGDTEEESVDVSLSPEKEEGEVKLEPEGETTADSPGEELEEYSAGVKTRINELTKRFREEERQKQSAIQYAENVQKENASLKTRIDSLDKGYQEQFDGRVSSELDSTKRILKEAHETGDVDRLVDAQEALASLSVQKTALDAEKAKVSPEVPVDKPPAPPQPQAPPDPRAQAWARENDWFGNDEVMTYGAFGIHRRLVEDEGFDPTSDAYYVELDNRLKSEFPHKLDTKSKSNGGRKVASAESSASRNKSGRKTVRLTPSQVAIAKRLNVPLEEYAKYVRD